MEARDRLWRELGWVIDLAAPVVDGGFLLGGQEINWGSNLQVGPYILNCLPRTLQLVRHAKLPANVITFFVLKGYTDKQLPHDTDNLGFLTDSYRELFLKAQKALLLSFEQGEHKDLNPGDMVPFTEADDDDEFSERKGTYGVVTKVLEGQQEMCRKMLRADTPQLREQAMNEYHFFSRLPKAPHLLQLRASYTQGGHHFLVLEPWVTLDLRKLLDNPSGHQFWTKTDRKDRPRIIIGWMLCLLASLATLHSHKKKHIDLKPDNIGLKVDDDGAATPFILDHGHSREFTSDSMAIEKFGSTYYASPEKSDQQKEGRKGDVFSLGVIFMELLSLEDSTIKKRWNRAMVVNKWEVPPATALLKKPEWYAEVFDSAHEVVRKLGEVIGKMLRIDSCSRISAKEAWEELKAQAWMTDDEVHCLPVLKVPSPLGIKTSQEPENEDESGMEELPDETAHNPCSWELFLESVTKNLNLS